MTTATRSLRRASIAPALLLLALLFSTASAGAETTCSKYASPSGSDSAAGTVTAPYRTAQRLADSLSAGQTGCLREGSYTASGPYVLSPGHGGSATAPIAIRSYPGEHARLVGIVNVAHGIDHVTLSDLLFEGTGGSNSVKIYSPTSRSKAARSPTPGAASPA